MSSQLLKRPNIIQEVKAKNSIEPVFIQGDSLQILQVMPDESVDFAMTSPPYWSMREYSNGGIGLEDTYHDFINNLLKIFKELQRVLKNTGSFWLNIGDSYYNKQLVGIPWRIAIRMMDEQGWHLRNEVIWNKVKGGPDQAKDKLGNVHEQVFHFVKNLKNYYYDVDAIRNVPKTAKVINGSIISATGVSGIRYKRQIELSSTLRPGQKVAARKALDEMIQKMKNGELSDFRMVIRGTQRTTHSDSENLSGRAKELLQKGFYFLKYHKNGSKPRDVWDILPEDTHGRGAHYAAYPADLCRIPIMATCPKSGIVLDPFVGTGTTTMVAKQLGRKSIGIDISDEYIQIAKERCNFLS